MTSALVIGGRRIGSVTLLMALAGVALVVAVITPESMASGSGGRSSYSTGTGGVRIVYELAQRMGWQTTRRETPLDSTVDSAAAQTVQVVLAPQQALGAVEVHRLLENVRHGGGLLFDVDDGEEIADSLGLAYGKRESMLVPGSGLSECREGPVRTRGTFIIPPTIHALRWRRPPPGAISPIAAAGAARTGMDVGISFPMGVNGGRVVAMSSSDVFSNYFVRTCGWGADVASARALEAARPFGVNHPRIVFDEFHHGYGAHGGSTQAVSLYLAHAASGHFLAQAMIAALILLFASAPRPIAPRDPERIARRSPLEHADALAHAYFDVAATRTATSRLVSGLRRRAGRTVSVAPAADDMAFLDAVSRRIPALAEQVQVVRRALSDPLRPREFAAVAGAVQEIEQQLTTSPPARS